ncbi:restriction endonuclease subunit S [Acinetobacter sichuanensis]|uniref:Restriction endonuclease subunit S n=1 Tax=Acinetobacter sichuanensis TaxID=2136183 RepID=A0A371YNF4_9GAMM|nr:restriction endonuclease subunit S [Acinetobacter sichuanensis]RFC83007.1 restriction endonuclease subunit S [Acinetobacter sichuanensis]
MAKYQKYAEYKDSGVEWLGEIPSHWRVSKVKYLAPFQVGWTPPTKNDANFIGENLWVNISDLKAKTITSTSKQISDKAALEASMDITPKGSLMYSFKLSVGAVSFAGCDMYTNEAIASFLDTSKLPLSFLYYVLPKFVIENASTNIYGAKILNQELIRNANLIELPFEEAENIANFLDHETAKIDSLIAKQEKLIELLKEKRQAVISHAVTKGLNPDVKMKDSGVEWLGQVPEHWRVSRFKFVCSSIIAGPFGSSITKDMYVPKGYKVYGQEQVIPNDFEIGDYYISEKNYIELSRYAVYPRDILISCVGTFGKIAVFPENAEKGIINPRLIKATVSNKFNPYFFREYLKSDAVFKQFEQLSRGGTMGVINIGILNEIIAVIPPIKEQDDIYNFIQQQKYKFNSLIKKAESAIQLMQERRTTLISYAVTGKIDVRNWQNPNHNNNEVNTELGA